jgi:predicted transcriptional regulator
MNNTQKVLNYFKENKGASANDCARYLSEQNGTSFNVTNICNILNRLAVKGLVTIPQSKDGRNDYSNMIINYV